MAVKYPNLLNLRLSDEDVMQIEKMSQKFHTPPSTLVRRAWREWSATQLMEKTAS